MGYLAYHKALTALEVVWLPGNLFQLFNNSIYFILGAKKTSMKTHSFIQNIYWLPFWREALNNCIYDVVTMVR